MFPFIGIQADEEPKTPISASGLYNSSLINSTYNEYSDYLLESLSEFTIMAWVRFDAGGGTNRMTIYGGLYDNLGSPSTGHFSFEGDNGSDRIDFSIKSSASTTLNVSTITTNLAEDTWYHLCVTGSVLDNELKLFLDGQLIKTSTMPYSIGIPWNATSSKSYSKGSVPFYMAQFNVFERRLTEVEVLEHYVYDDDTMSSGALGWDAMTPTQRSGLIYSSSFTDDISISGNEFNDKSGSGITVSPQPSLTGEQIYFYTNASDLPSDTTIYNVNSATLNGTNQYYDAGNPVELQITGNMSVSIWVIPEVDDQEECIASKYSYSDNQRAWVLRTRLGKYEFYVDDSGTGGGVDNAVSTTNVTIGQPVHLVGEYNGASFKIFVNATEEDSQAHNTGIFNTSANVRFGAYDNSTGSGNFEFNGGLFQPIIYSRVLSQPEKTYLASNPTKCWDLMVAEMPSLADAEIAPPLGNWNNETGSETVDKSSNNLPVSPANAPTYTDQGMTVEC